MKPSRRLPFARLLVLFFSIAIPLFVIAHLQVRSTIRKERESAEHQSLAAAKLGASGVDEYLRGLESYLEAYSRNPALVEGVRRRDEARIRRVLLDLAENNPRVDRAFVTDAAGIELSDYPRDPAVIGRSFAYRDWFRGVAGSESTYVSSVYRRAAGNQERTIAVATPIRAAPGKAVGYLVGQVLVSSLERQLAQTPAAGLGEILVLDRMDAIVTGADSVSAAAVHDAIGAIVKLCRSGKPIQRGILVGTPHVVAYAKAPALGGCVLAVGDLRSAIASESAMSRVVYSLAAAMALLLALFPNAILERRARRIEELAQAALHESELRFRATFEQAAVGIVHFSSEGRMLRVNQKVCDILGYTREELLRRELREIIRPVNDGRRAPEKSRDLTRPGGGEGVHREERELLRRDASTVWCQLTVAPVIGENGRPEYFTGVIEDISERKRLEEQFLQSQKMRAIGQLAGGIAHDFNNLLTTILGYCELLQRRLKEEDPLRTYADEICKAGERASSLTAQLLAFSRKQILKPRPINLNEVVGGMDRLLRRLIDQNIALGTRLDPDLGTVMADPGQIEQVVMNLVVNARDAAPRDGRITIETAKAVVDNAAVAPPGLEPGTYATLSVTDTGHGMDAATRARLFEPFFTTKEMGKGTGLGLSTVYGIVKQSGGAITVSSEPGKGSTFRIYLPTTEVEATPAREEAPLPAERDLRGVETVLLVEDDNVLRSLTRSVLQENGYTVLEAAGGNDALALCERHEGPIHAMLTDMVMPQMSGAVLAERVRSLHPETKVIYQSGYTDEAEYGPLDPTAAFLQKPYTPGSLLRILRETLDAPAAAPLKA